MGEIPISFRRDGPICARARRSDQTVNAVIKDQWRRVDCGVQDLLETDAIVDLITFNTLMYWIFGDISEMNDLKVNHQEL